MSSNLENEDLINVPLVRMEDVQPSRERADNDVLYETCIIDDIECTNEYIVEDEDSNIGSMVSLQSEELEGESSSQELIIPELLEDTETENDEPEVYVEKEESSSEVYLEYDLETFSDDDQKDEASDTLIEDDDVEKQIDAHIEASRMLNTTPTQNPSQKSSKTSHQESVETETTSKVIRISKEIKPPTESWPTLEILPGGVIKNTEKYESESCLYPTMVRETVDNCGDMMYACAKCSQTFKYLFCLVKHVKWHEDQNKIIKDPETGKLSETEKELLNLKRERHELDKVYKKKKLEVFARVAVAMAKIGKAKKIFNK